MNINNVYALYFSPTGNTKKVVRALAGGIFESIGSSDKLPDTSAGIHDIDISTPVPREAAYSFSAGDIVVVGTCVYAGRIPNKILPFYQNNLKGGGAIAVPVVTYGNRSYDDALMELKLELESSGFSVAAAAAIPCEHAFATKIGTGRPTDSDLKEIKDFGKAIATELFNGQGSSKEISVPGNNPVGPYYTPLMTNGEPAKFLKAKPKTDETKCTRCGRCAAVCSMGSINKEDPRYVPGICIKCQACIKVCPKGAKYFDDPAFLSHKDYLEQHYTRGLDIRTFI